MLHYCNVFTYCLRYSTHTVRYRYVYDKQGRFLKQCLTYSDASKEPLLYAWDLMAGMRERGEERVLGRKAGRPGRVNSYRPDRFPANRPTIGYHYCVWQCSGSVTFLYGYECESGSSDPYLWITDPDADPYHNLQWLWGCQQNQFFHIFWCFKKRKDRKICLMIKLNF